MYDNVSLTIPRLGNFIEIHNVPTPIEDIRKEGAFSCSNIHPLLKEAKNCKTPAEVLAFLEEIKKNPECAKTIARYCHSGVTDLNYMRPGYKEGFWSSVSDKIIAPSEVWQVERTLDDIIAVVKNIIEQNKASKCCIM